MTLHQPVHAHDQSGPHIGHDRSNSHEYSSEHWNEGFGSRSQVSISGLHWQSYDSWDAATTRQLRTLSASCCTSGSAFAFIDVFGPSVMKSSFAAFGPSVFCARSKTSVMCC